ncbi:MAG: hypothetical protein JXA37_12800 [Chloroflexia bacterium]|nr:hypothetical protein [Chloroflexia bacterium]
MQFHGLQNEGPRAGRFTALLDFGPVFTGTAHWLQVAVRCPGDGAYITLPRQPLTAAPYALYSLAAPWDGLAGVPAGFADGVDDVDDADPANELNAGLPLSGTACCSMTPGARSRPN